MRGGLQAAAVIRWALVGEVTIPGSPVAKARPRFARVGNGVRTYPNPKTEAYEKLVSHCVAWDAAFRCKQGTLAAPAGVPVRVDIVAYFVRPKALNRKADPAGAVPHAVRPDLDNVIKATIDGIQKAGCVFNDDGQVQCIRAESWYHEKAGKPRTVLAVYIPSEYIDRTTD